MGGESQSNQAELFVMVFQAIDHGETTEAEQTLAVVSRGDVPAWNKPLLAKLQTILHGDRGRSESVFSLCGGTATAVGKPGREVKGVARY